MHRRARIHQLVDPANPGTHAVRVRTAELVVNLLGIVSVSAGTLDALTDTERMLASLVTGAVAVFFLAEYLVRLWVAAENDPSSGVSQTQARLRWALSPMGVIDLLAVVPAIAVASGGARLGAESASVFVILWVLKLAARSTGVSLIARVFINERESLGAAAALFLIVLFSSATVVHWLEAQAQPQQFGSIPASLWWAVVTLTTTGYGDVVPQSAWGRAIGGLVMLAGIAVLALLAGILASGFAQELRRREFIQIWNLVARVPFFSDVGAIALADIVGQLHSRSVPAGTTVFRKGEQGEAMYFLVSGTVEVHLPHGAVAMHEGEFFGEMALLDRKPRVATVVTTTPCTMLVLDVADFYRLAGQQPALVQAIEQEAHRRKEAHQHR